ncbi:MAG: DNA-binding response regulator [Bacteroidetes bacterium]|nr:MAG: DNA-binding response regulator [Bacteroidota bacterium]
MDKPGILIVEDDLYMGILLKDVFENKGFVANHFTCAMDGLESFKDISYDLCLFDVDLPDENGFTLARKVQKINDNIPIIFLTAQTLKEDVITGLSLGADDYILKPFNLEELILRVNNILKRSGKTYKSVENSVFQIGQFQFDYAFQQLIFVEEEQILTHKEAELLKMFCENKNLILKREDVIEKIWGEYTLSHIRSMDVYITRLRKYLKKDPTVEIINVRGEGYKLRIDQRNQ